MGINVYGTFNFHFQRCLQALGIYKMIEIPSQPLNCQGISVSYLVELFQINVANS